MHRENKIIITPELVCLVETMAKNYAAAIGADPVGYYLQYYLDIAPHAAIISTIGREFGFKKDDRILEIGSGLGTRCLIGTAIFGAEFTGLEPCANSYSDLEMAIAAFRKANRDLYYHSIATSGESTGLPDGCFDHVVSFEVLEHVQNPAQVIAEMFRVLKPGGRIFISSCNYASFYEGHFRSVWLPFLKRNLQKKYLRLIGRNENFLDEINLITKGDMLRHFSKVGFGDISFRGEYSFVPLRDFHVQYPDGYAIDRRVGKPKLIQRLVQSPRVERLLAKFDREYKLYLTAVKPAKDASASVRTGCHAGKS